MDASFVMSSRSRICCFLDQTRVLCSAGLSPPTESPLQALRENCVGSEGGLCTHQHQKTSLEGSPWREEMLRVPGREGTRRSLLGAAWWRGWDSAVRWATYRPPSQEHQHLSYFIVKSRHLCSVEWGDGREGPTEPHIQLSPKSFWSREAGLLSPLHRWKLRTRASVDAALATFQSQPIP